MNSATPVTAACHEYELEIAISASKSQVWQALFEETNQWWLADFHVVSADSTVTFDPRPGGSGLLETTPDGGGLLWYSVHMYLPADDAIYLVGHIAPQWGGPTTSLLKISLEETESGCNLRLGDARHGNVDPAQIKSYEEGWTQLFTEGLKAYVEAKGSS